MLHSLLSQNCLLLELISVHNTEKQCQLPPSGTSHKVLKGLRMCTSYSDSRITMTSFLQSKYCIVCMVCFCIVQSVKEMPALNCVGSLPAFRVWKLSLGFWLSTFYYSKYKNRKYKILYPGSWRHQKVVVQQNHWRAYKVNMEELHQRSWTSHVLLLLSSPIKISSPCSLIMNSSTTRKNAQCQKLLATEYSRAGYTISDGN